MNTESFTDRPALPSAGFCQAEQTGPTAGEPTRPAQSPPDTTRRRLLAGASLVTGGLLSGCSGLDLVNATSMAGAGERLLDLPFGPHPRHRLDAYKPRGTPPATGWPTVLFFYGGTWRRGERAEYRFVGESLASRGILTLIADYRLYPEVRWPSFLEDSALAVHWVMNEGAGASLPLDPRKLHLMGHSAGAYNAAMLALDPRWLAPHGRRPDQLAGWVGLAGPYDFLPLRDQDAQPVFHHPNYPPDTQPIHLVRPGAPRAFLAASVEDRLVSTQRSTVSLARKLQEAQVPTTLRLYDRVDHITLVGALSRPLRWMAPVLDDVSGFVLGA